MIQQIGQGETDSFMVVCIYHPFPSPVQNSHIDISSIGQSIKETNPKFAIDSRHVVPEWHEGECQIASTE